MRRTTVLALSLTAGLVVVGGSAAAIALNAPSTPTPTAAASAPVVEVVDPQPGETTLPAVDATTASLLFMIEEEKLAHDVYVTLGDLWGGRIFTNIAASESTHQGQVFTLLEARDLGDPRSSEIGVFTDDTLQALYDDLIAMGSESRDAAMQVGVTIEEKDIADLATAITAEDEADVIAVYERLISGSENHLAAFERQI